MSLSPILKIHTGTYEFLKLGILRPSMRTYVCMSNNNAALAYSRSIDVFI